MPLLHPAFFGRCGGIRTPAHLRMKLSAPMPQRYLARVEGFEPTSVSVNSRVPSPRRLHPNKLGGEDENRTHLTELAKLCRLPWNMPPQIGISAKIRTQTFGFGDRRATVNTTLILEARVGFEPTNTGFADQAITSLASGQFWWAGEELNLSPERHGFTDRLREPLTFPTLKFGADDWIRTSTYSLEGCYATFNTTPAKTYMERIVGFEPTTFSMATKRSTSELYPRVTNFGQGGRVRTDVLQFPKLAD